MQHVIDDRASLMRLPRPEQARARANAHLGGGKELDAGHRVFLGEIRRSRRFQKAVDLEAFRPEGLLYKAFTTADRSPLVCNGKPHWSSSLRTCRAMWDLNDGADRARATLIQRAIEEMNDYNLLEGV